MTSALHCPHEQGDLPGHNYEGRIRRTFPGALYRAVLGLAAVGRTVL